MSLAERLVNDMKYALKTGEKDSLSAIRLVRSAIKNREIEKSDALSDEEINGVLQSLARQSRESLEQFVKGGRKDLAGREEKYLSVILSYLPEQLSEEELGSIILKAVQGAGAKGPQDMGRVMKAVIPEVRGRADNRVVSDLVKKLLLQSASDAGKGKE
jgi:uncharacterized protein YqeY